MVPWWTLIISGFAGLTVGVILTALCAYDTVRNPTRKWWEDEF